MKILIDFFILLAIVLFILLINGIVETIWILALILPLIKVVIPVRIVLYKTPDLSYSAILGWYIYGLCFFIIALIHALIKKEDKKTTLRKKRER
ncbi:hypothetical protein GUI12_03600 [Anaplasmataceae bacterium AB001_6]|nr:hypothetical protein GUI12_03600 [Anaplasmataceae bacterium AB001_6]